MTTAHQERLLPFSPQQLFDLVNDVESYPQFIPWCVAARIRKRETNFQQADLMIGFKMVKERFTSNVHSDPDAMTIRAEAARGPFKHLTNLWEFTPDPQGREDHCLVKLSIDFEFSNKLLQKLIEVMFEEAQKRMIYAFETRAKALYGEAQSNPATRVDDSAVATA